jgi:hypothetical protein
MLKIAVPDWKYLVFWLVLLSLNPALTRFPVMARESSCPIPSAAARGEAGNLPILAVYKGSGLNISFLPLSKRVKKVWLDDPSRIAVDFDAPLNRGASVIHLKRIEAVNFPRVPKSGSTLLTVIVENPTDAGGTGANNNGRERYQFRVTYGDKGQPACYGYDVLPDSVASSAPNGSVLEEESLLREGLAIALRRGTISAEAGNTVLKTRVRHYIDLRKRGAEEEEARQKARVSAAFLDRLSELAASERERASVESSERERSAAASGSGYPEEYDGEETDSIGCWFDRLSASVISGEEALRESDREVTASCSLDDDALEDAPYR